MYFESFIVINYRRKKNKRKLKRDIKISIKSVFLINKYNIINIEIKINLKKIIIY